MHGDPLIPPMVGVVAVILVLGMLLQAFRQPQLVGYIIAGIIEGFGYQMTIAVIALSLLFSPGWIAASKWLLKTRS